MKHSKENSPKKSLKPIIIAILILTAIIAVVVFIFFFRSCNNSTANSSVSTTTESYEEVVYMEELMNTIYADSDKTTDIVTDYIDLKYPEKWEKYVDAENIKLDDTDAVKFTATVLKKKIELFTVRFDDKGENQIGQVDTKDGSTCSISFSLNSVETAKNWNEFSQEQQQAVNAMIEDINCIISNLNNQ